MRIASILGPVWLSCCAPAAPCPVSVPGQASQPAPTLASTTPTPPTMAASTQNKNRRKLAVLPFDDDQLFRAERRALRNKLTAEIAARLPDYDVMPLAEVDAKLAPVSKSGARCAFEHEPLERRAGRHGWLTTSLIHLGAVKGSSEELWVVVSDGRSDVLTLAAPWDPKLGLVARYERAFAALKRLDDAGSVGGLGGRFTRKGEVKVGGLTLCQGRRFRDCTPETAGFADRAKELSACFGAADHADYDLLLEGPARCELQNLHDPTGADGQREACLCAALSKSAGPSAVKGRGQLDVSYEKPELVGKPRPEIRVLESSTNLHAEDDWHGIDREDAGKKTYSSVRRLRVENVDSVRPALAGCGLAKSSVIVAELSLGDAGAVRSARVVVGAKSKRESACVEKALATGVFACTNDGNPATLRVSIAMPD